MGLFDGKVIDLGNRLADNLDIRAAEIHKEWHETKDVGYTLTLKIIYMVFQELSKVIRKTVNDE